MAIIDLRNNAKYFGDNVDIPPDAKIFVFQAGRDILCPIYSEEGFNQTVANPIEADENGDVPFFHLVDGSYKFVIRDARNNLVREQDEIVIRSAFSKDLAHRFDTLADVLETDTLSYQTGTGRKVVDVGDTVFVSAGKHTYKVAPPDANDHHLKTAGDVKLHVVGPQFDVGALVGQNGSDITTSFEALMGTAFNIHSDYRSNHRSAFWDSSTASIFIPPGTYRVTSGFNLGQGTVAEARSLVLWAVPGTVRIEVDPGVDLFTMNGRWRNCVVHGVNFVGGDRHFRFIHAGNQTGARFLFQHCIFQDYVKSAIVSESVDHPHWAIEDCTFQAASSAPFSIAIALGGYLDQCRVKGNRFFGDTGCNIKFDPGSATGLSGSWHLSQNDFIAYSGYTPTANIWLVPGDDPASTNSAYGATIEQNKFGNENYSGWPRILVDVAQAGERDVAQPAGVYQDSPSLNMSGIIVVANRWVLAGNQYQMDPTSCLISSYISNLRNWIFKSNVIEGGSPAYVVHFEGDRTESDGMGWWDAELPLFRNSISNGLAFSNHPIGFIENKSGGGDISEGARLLPMPDEAGTIIAVSATNELKAFGGATAIARPDALGGTNAVQLTFSAEWSGLYDGLAELADTAVMGWATFDIKRADTEAVDEVFVGVRNYTNFRHAARELIRVPSEWRTVCIPFLIPYSTAHHAWQFVLLPRHYAAGVRTKVDIGRVRVYSGRAPLNNGHLRAFGGGFDQEHMVLGGHHIWVDSTGKLRIKPGAPTSDLDGALV